MSQVNAYLLFYYKRILFGLEKSIFQVYTLINNLREMLLDRVLKLNDVHLDLPLETCSSQRLVLSCWCIELGCIISYYKGWRHSAVCYWVAIKVLKRGILGNKSFDLI